MKLKFRNKIIVLAVLSAVIPMLVVFGLLFKLEADLVDQSSRGLEKLAAQHGELTTGNIYGLCTLADNNLNDQLDQTEKTARELLRMKGGLTEGETVTWRIPRPGAPDKVVDLPALSIGEHVFLPGMTLDEPQPLVDAIFNMTGMDASLFQVINEQGDMLRVASTVKNQEQPDRRAVGTLFPAVLPDGRPNPATAPLMAGRAHRGLDLVMGNVYLAARFPIQDEAGRVFATLGIGRKIDTVDFIADILQNMHVGEKGYVWVVRADESAKGLSVVSERGLRDGENILDAQDAQGRFYVREIIEKATSSKPGTIHFDRLDIRNTEDEEYAIRHAAYTWFEPWQWIIGTSSIEDEYKALNDRIREETRESMDHLALVTLLAVLLLSALAFAFSKYIVRPLKQITRVAETIADGNLVEAQHLTNASAESSTRPPRDEIDALNRSFVTMTQSLGKLLGQVQHSGVQVTTSATQIAAAARQLEATSVEQAASTRAITQTTSGITLTTRELAQTMRNVSETVDHTADVAEQGRTRLGDMQSAMQNLLHATETFSAKLAIINEKTGRITSVVTTINAISDQTNLLSLNAAIEAEKAGEHGRGFMVVAREITRLADQVATATRDIEYVVREMESSVSSGVMEMDKFAEGVRSSTGEVDAVSGQLSSVIDQVRELAPLFDHVQEGMNQQAGGAGQINKTMEELAQAADQSRDSLHEFQSVTEQLHEAVLGLQREVSRFKL